MAARQALVTPRLILEPMTLALVEAVFRSDRDALEQIAGAKIPAAWPGRVLVERAFSASLEAIRSDPEGRLWGDCLMILREGDARLVIGSIIFHGPPRRDGRRRDRLRRGGELAGQGHRERRYARRGRVGARAGGRHVGGRDHPALASRLDPRPREVGARARWERGARDPRGSAPVRAPERALARRRSRAGTARAPARSGRSTATAGPSPRQTSPRARPGAYSIRGAASHDHLCVTSSNVFAHVHAVMVLCICSRAPRARRRLLNVVGTEVARDRGRLDGRSRDLPRGFERRKRWRKAAARVVGGRARRGGQRRGALLFALALGCACGSGHGEEGDGDGMVDSHPLSLSEPRQSRKRPGSSCPARAVDGSERLDARRIELREAAIAAGVDSRTFRSLRSRCWYRRRGRARLRTRATTGTAAMYVSWPLYIFCRKPTRSLTSSRWLAHFGQFLVFFIGCPRPRYPLT